MNPLEIIEQVRAYKADVVLENDKLVLRGQGDRLPEELRDQVRQHKSELIVALGGSTEAAIAEVLKELRPHLPPHLRTMPDGKLLILVNWAILQAWGKAVASVHL